eukprot:SAG22_NODE_519_length_9510_cov_6.192222_8_plen_195_part_00
MLLSDCDRYCLLTAACWTNTCNLVILLPGDNAGPPLSAAEVRATWNISRSWFPTAAEIVASDLDAFTAAASKFKRFLPVVEKEIGDTWVMGVPSDPNKVAAMRAIDRQLSACTRDPECAGGGSGGEGSSGTGDNSTGGGGSTGDSSTGGGGGGAAQVLLTNFTRFALKVRQVQSETQKPFWFGAPACSCAVPRL